MRKLLLTTAIAMSTFAIATAGGYCRVGSANLSDNGNGTATLTCPGNGTCYETDNSGNTGPGHIITIHMRDGSRLQARVLSGKANNHPPTTPPDQPTTQLPQTLVVQILQD